MPASFVHLRLHTEYSLVDGLVRVKPLIKAVAAGGMPAVAVTDMSNIAGEVLQDGAGRRNQTDLWRRYLAGWLRRGWSSQPPDAAGDEPQGYRNLTELISRGWTEGQRNDLVIIEREWVKEAAEGLIALSGAKGEIGHALLNGDEALAASRLAEWREVFADRFYLEVQRTNRVNDEEHLHAAVALAERSGAAGGDQRRALSQTGRLRGA